MRYCQLCWIVWGMDLKKIGIGKVKAEADSTKLRSFLANLPGDDD